MVVVRAVHLQDLMLAEEQEAERSQPGETEATGPARREEQEVALLAVPQAHHRDHQAEIHRSEAQAVAGKILAAATEPAAAGTTRRPSPSRSRAAASRAAA